MADRIGVINDGALIVVEEKRALIEKLGKKRLILQLRKPLQHIPEELGRLGPGTASGRRRTGIFLRGKPQHRHIGAGTAPKRTVDRFHRHAHAAKLLGRHLRQSREQTHMNASFAPPRFNRYGVLGDLQVRDREGVAHAGAEPRHAGHHDFPVFHRLRSGDRLADEQCGRRQLRSLHRAGADHVDAVHRKHRERFLRDLLPKIHRLDIRTAVGARLAARNRHRLCRRRGEQIAGARSDHPCDVGVVRSAEDFASRRDACVAAADRLDLQSVRIHRRYLGARDGNTYRSFRPSC